MLFTDVFISTLVWKQSFFNNEYLTLLLTRTNKEEKMWLFMRDPNINLPSSVIQNLRFPNSLIICPCIFFLDTSSTRKISETFQDLDWERFYKHCRVPFLLRKFHISNIRSSKKVSPSNQSDSFERNYKVFNDDEFKHNLKIIPWQRILSQTNP